MFQGYVRSSPSEPGVVSVQQNVSVFNLAWTRQSGPLGCWLNISQFSARILDSSTTAARLNNSKAAYRTSRHHSDIKKRHGSNSSILHVHCRFLEGHRHGLDIVLFVFPICVSRGFEGTDHVSRISIRSKWN